MRPPALLTLALAPMAIAQMATAPQCQPTDTTCFITKAQYTVLGTVLGNNIGVSDPTTGVTGTAENYNATVNVQCVYASTNPTMNSGANILGQTVTVTGFGTSRKACPNGGGASAAANQSNIFFLFVANTPPKGQIPILSVFDICTGGLSYDNTHLQSVGNVLASNSQLAFYGASRGPASCTVPGLPQDAAPTSTTASSNGTPTTVGGANLPGSGASDVKVGWVGGVVAGLAAVVGALLA
ncbi:hypothetical protein HDV00_002441 [Rhizophlyctis rosea]|nr:hypothetical protein HDV00_002441 [Rhizophlyctis rosea]